MVGFGIGMVYYGVLWMCQTWDSTYTWCSLLCFTGGTIFYDRMLLAWLKMKTFTPCLLQSKWDLLFDLFCGIGNKWHMVKLVVALVSFFEIATSFDVFLINIVEFFPHGCEEYYDINGEAGHGFCVIFSPFFYQQGGKMTFFLLWYFRGHLLTM